MKGRSAWVAAAAIAAALLCALETPAAQVAVGCSISSSAFAFGTYNPLAVVPTDSIGTITYECTAGVLIRVDLSQGSSGTFTARTMSGPAGTLTYNLYLDAARLLVWGDGTGGSQSYTELATALVQRSVPVHGRIPASQDAAVGSYTDTLTATIVF